MWSTTVMQTSSQKYAWRSSKMHPEFGMNVLVCFLRPVAGLKQQVYFLEIPSSVCSVPTEVIRSYSYLSEGRESLTLSNDLLNLLVTWCDCLCEVLFWNKICCLTASSISFSGSLKTNIDLNLIIAISLFPSAQTSVFICKYLFATSAISAVVSQQASLIL